MVERGFVLTPTYRIALGVAGVHLHAVLECGEPALIVDDRMPPYFFVPRDGVEFVRRIAPAARVTQADLRTFAGTPILFRLKSITR